MIHSWFGKIGKQTKLSAVVLMTATVCLLSACGEYFGQEWPEEFDPDKLPSITSIDGLNNTINMYVGDELTMNAWVGSNQLSALNDSLQRIVMSRLYARADKGDTIVMVRQLSLKAMAAGTDVVTFSNADGDWSGWCRVAVSERPSGPSSITLPRAILTLMEGESYKLSAAVEPAQYADDALTWTTSNRSVAGVSNGMVTASSTGSATITVTTSNGLSASVTVVVLPDWSRMAMTGFRYESIVYARITVDGEAFPDGCMYTSLCGDEYRGFGAERTARGVTYVVFRVGSNAGRGDGISFEGYDKKNHSLITFDKKFTFVADEVHGSLSSLYELSGTREK